MAKPVFQEVQPDARGVWVQRFRGGPHGDMYTGKGELDYTSLTDRDVFQAAFDW